MIAKKLIKNIEFKGIVEGQEQTKYHGINPIVINGNSISFDSSNYYNKGDVDSLIRQVKPNGYEALQNQVHNNTNDINANNNKIDRINTQIQALEQNQTNDVSFVGEIIAGQTYYANDYGYVGDKWYIATSDTNGDVNNGVWKETSGIQQKINLDNYYTKTQTNELLKPLDTRLNDLNNGIVSNTNEINELKNNISEITRDIDYLYEDNDTIQVRLSGMSRDIDANKQNISNINNSINDTNNKTQELENNLNNLSQSVEHNTREIDSNQSLINDLTSKHNQLVNDTPKLNGKNQFNGVNNFEGIIQVTGKLGVTDGIYVNKILDNHQILRNNFELADDSLIIVKGQDANKLNNANGKAITTKEYVDTKLFDLNQRIQNLEANYEIWKTKIIELGNGLVKVCGQVNLHDYKNRGQDLYGALPQAIKDLRNVDNIESFNYNLVELNGNKNKVFSSKTASIAASVYSNRIYLVNEEEIPSYIGYLRFELIYTKR